MDTNFEDVKARQDRLEETLARVITEQGNIQRQLGAIRKHLGLVSNTDYSLSKAKSESSST